MSENERRSVDAINVEDMSSTEPVGENEIVLRALGEYFFIGLPKMTTMVMSEGEGVCGVAPKHAASRGGGGWGRGGGGR